MSAANEIDHMLEALRGPAIERFHLVKSAKKASAVTIILHQGRVVSLNNATPPAFETGAALCRMPLYVWRPSNALDVYQISTDYSSLTPPNKYATFQATPDGEMTAFVATGGFEFATTEFDTTQTYAVNELLTSTVANTTQATGGLITNVGTSSSSKVRPHVDHVVGVVSGKVYTNHHGKTVLPFWSYFLPSNVNP